MENQNKNKLLNYQKNNNKVLLRINSALITKNNLTNLCIAVDKILCTLGNHYLITVEYLPFCLLKNHLKRPNIKFKTSAKTDYCKLPQCKNCKEYNYCYGIPTILNKILQNEIKPIIDKLDEIVIEITRSCNHNCRMCFAKSKTKKVPDPSIDRINTIMNEMKSLNINTIRFTGGEPLLKKDIFEILRLAKKNNFYVILNTNATLLSTNKIRILEKFVDNVLTSVHGHNQNTETQSTRNKTLFKQKIANIYKLTRSSIPIIRVGSIMTNNLIKNYEKYYKLLTTIGIKNWEIYRPMISSHLTKTHPEFNVSKNDIKKCINFLYKINLKGINAKIANPVPFCITNNEQKARLTLSGSHADDGRSRLVYSFNGYFKTSYFLNINLGYTIVDALNNSFLKKINSFDYLPKQCKNCNLLRHCAGGSRFLAFQSHKNYFQLDPLAAKFVT